MYSFKVRFYSPVGFPIQVQSCLRPHILNRRFRTVIFHPPHVWLWQDFSWPFPFSSCPGAQEMTNVKKLFTTRAAVFSHLFWPPSARVLPELSVFLDSRTVWISTCSLWGSLSCRSWAATEAALSGRTHSPG